MQRTTRAKRDRALMNVASLARSYTPEAIQTLAGLMRNGESETVRMNCAVHLLDRGWGRPEQSHDLSNSDIQITIRTLLEPRPVQGRVIEHNADGPSDPGA